MKERLFRGRFGVSNKVIKLTLIAFIVSISIALIETIWSIYIDSFVNNVSLVGFISAGLTVVSFISYFIIIPIIEKWSKSKLYLLSLVVYLITYILFAINTKFYIFVILAFVIAIFGTLRITSMGIMVKDSSPRTKLSLNEGFWYTFVNISWVLGPLIAGYVANKQGINIIFILSSIFIAVALFLFIIFKIKDNREKKKIDVNLIKNFIDFFRDKNRFIIYLLSGGVGLWWVLIYLFMPLFIIRNGLSEIWVGYFLFGVALPLISLEYFFGKLAGKKGFRKLFQIGYLIVCVLALISFFVSNVYVIIILLALGSIGVAMLEATTESYFFDIIKRKDDLRFYGPYNTSNDAVSLVGKIIASTLIIFLPFKFIFMIFSVYMFLLFLLSFKTKKIIESKLK